MPPFSLGVRTAPELNKCGLSIRGTVNVVGLGFDMAVRRLCFSVPRRAIALPKQKLPDKRV